MAQIKIIETGEVIEVAAQPEWVNGIWECGDVRFTDHGKTLYAAVVESPQAPKVSPIQFKLLFTSGERIAIKSSTDPVVQDFYEITNDPRLTHVDLSLKSTQDAIAYLVHVGILTQERADAVLAGTTV